MSATTTVKDDVFQEQVIRAAQLLFQKHGLQKVTMDDVAKAVGKGRSSLYYYYKSKEEILDAVMDVEIDEIMSEISKAVDQVMSVEQKIHVFCATKLKITRKRRALYSAMDAGMNADEMSAFTKARNAIHKRLMKKESTLLKKVLQLGIEKGELRPINSKEQDMLVFVLLSTVHGLKREMIIDNDFGKIEPAIDVLTNMVIHGLKK